MPLPSTGWTRSSGAAAVLQPAVADSTLEPSTELVVLVKVSPKVQSSLPPSWPALPPSRPRVTDEGSGNLPRSATLATASRDGGSLLQATSASSASPLTRRPSPAAGAGDFRRRGRPR